MGVEAATYLNDLDTSLPTASDSKGQGDDHLRLIKSVLKTTLPGLAGVAWRTQSKNGSYTAAATDAMTRLHFITSTPTLQLPGAPLAAGWLALVTTDVEGGTIAPISGTVNGETSVKMLTNTMTVVISDGTNYFAFNIPQETETSFTAEMTVGVAKNAAFSPTTSSGSYQRVGRRINFSGFQSWTGKTASTGAAQWGTLPTSDNSVVGRGTPVQVLSFTGLNAGVRELYGHIAYNDTTVMLYAYDTALGYIRSLQDSDFASSGAIHVAGSYLAKQ